MNSEKLPRLPLTFELARKRIAAGKRGGYLIRRTLAGLGLLKKAYQFPLPPKADRVWAPLDWPGIEDYNIFKRYERDALQAVNMAMTAHNGDFALIDCGADVGVYSKLLLSINDQIKHITAFEPNERSFSILLKNFTALGNHTQLFCAAVGEKAGFGKLVSPNTLTDSHSKFIVEAAEGPIKIARIDDLSLPSHLALVLKLDIEGAEYEALLGAANTISQASYFVIQIEAHRDVARRINREPLDSVRLLRELGGEVDWVACNEKQGKTYANLSLNRPLFEQLPDGEIYDLVVWKRA